MLDSYSQIVGFAKVRGPYVDLVWFMDRDMARRTFTFGTLEVRQPGQSRCSPQRGA